MPAPPSPPLGLVDLARNPAASGAASAGQFLRFVLASGAAALANFGSRIAFSHFMAFVPAIVLAFGVGLASAFVLNRLLVFPDSTNSLGRQALWFVLINLAALVITLLVSLTLDAWLLPALGVSWHAPEIAHGLGILAPVFTSYLGHRSLTFRRA